MDAKKKPPPPQLDPPTINDPDYDATANKQSELPVDDAIIWLNVNDLGRLHFSDDDYKAFLDSGDDPESV